MSKFSATASQRRKPQRQKKVWYGPGGFKSKHYQPGLTSEPFVLKTDSAGKVTGRVPIDVAVVKAFGYAKAPATHDAGRLIILDRTLEKAETLANELKARHPEQNIQFGSPDWLKEISKNG